jgi:ABC-2 type transport system permease protein
VRTGRFGKLRVLVLMQIARLRSAWRPYLIVSSLMPLGIAVLLRAVMDERQIARFGVQIVAGSVVLAIAMTAIVMLAQRMAWMKESGALDFYSTLPVSRTAVVVSVLISFALFSLPGALIVVGLGALMFDLAFAAFWVVVPVWLLGAFALAGLGVVIGFAAPDEQLAGMYSNLVMMAILFLGIIPVARLPAWLAPARAVLPSTYAVNALKPGFQGTIDTGITSDLLMLALFGALSFWAVRGPLWPRSD